MAKERLKSPRARLFTALDLPGEVEEGLARWCEAELGDAALRPAARPFHVTLAFLGWQRERDIAAIAAVLQATRLPPPRLALRPDPVPRPPRGRPGLFALEAPSEGLEALAADLQRRLREARLYEPEKRPFWPHVTLARVRRERREDGRRGRPLEVARPPGSLPAALREPFDAVRITLYRSNVRHAGAEYTPLAQVELPHRQQ